MKRIALLLPLVFLIGCSEPPKPTTKDFATILGKWKVLHLTNGEEKENGQETFEIKQVGDAWKAIGNKDGKEYSVTLMMDTSTTPTTLKFVNNGQIVASYFVTFPNPNQMQWEATNRSYRALMEKTN